MSCHVMSCHFISFHFISFHFISFHFICKALVVDLLPRGADGVLEIFRAVLREDELLKGQAELTKQLAKQLTKLSLSLSSKRSK